jgi:histidyl-tRNA synthetase
MDKLDKIGPDGVAAELERRGIGVNGRKGFLALHGLWRARPLTDGASNSLEVLDALDEMLGPQTVASALDVQAIENLKAILGFARSTSADPRVSYDPFLARGLAYYTGAIMEIAVEGIGSLGGGGRYDHLIGMFLGREIPACGFSLGLERMLVVMGERDMFPESVTRGSSDVMVTLWNADARGDALALAGLLRAGGLRVDVYPEADKLGRQFKYASSRGFPFVVVVGDDERPRGDVTVKDMRSGEQRVVKREEVASYLKGQAPETVS